MKSLVFASLGLAALLAGAPAATAKTLVYCSEGSPENFTPAINTTGTSFDAALPVYDQLTEFKRGTTEVVPGLAESWDIADGGKTITFHLRKGVKFHTSRTSRRRATSTPTTCCSRSIGSGRKTTPTTRCRAASTTTSTTWTCRRCSIRSTKTDDYTVVVKLKEPNVAILANFAMDFMSIGSAEYADFLLKKGTPEQFDQAPVGTGPFSFVAYQKDSVIRYKKQPGLFRREGAGRRSRLRHHPRRDRALRQAEGGRMPRQRLSAAGRRRRKWRRTRR